MQVRSFVAYNVFDLFDLYKFKMKGIKITHTNIVYTVRVIVQVSTLQQGIRRNFH